MKIGILDLDFLYTPFKVPRLNVEVMKLCEYYTNNNDKVELLTLTASFEEYDKIIVVSERINIKMDLRERLESLPKEVEVEYFGSFFNNFKFLPLPKEITDLPIKTKHYKKILKKYSFEPANEACKKESLSLNYVRIYAYGKDHIDMKQILDGKKYYIVDNDLFTKPNFKDEVMIYLMMFPHNFHLLYPQLIMNEEQFSLYVQLASMGYTGMNIDLVVAQNGDEWNRIFSKYSALLKTLMIQTPGKTKLLFGYDPDNIYDESFFLKNIEESIKATYAWIENIGNITWENKRVSARKRNDYNGFWTIWFGAYNSIYFIFYALLSHYGEDCKRDKSLYDYISKVKKGLNWLRLADIKAVVDKDPNIITLTKKEIQVKEDFDSGRKKRHKSSYGFIKGKFEEWD